MDFPKSVPSVGLVDGRFVDEDPLAATPGSLIPAAWGNAITLEVLNVILAAGLEPDEANLTQLLQAIRSIGRASDWDYALDTGSAGVYVAAYSPALTAVSDAMVLWFKAKTANSGASTFSPNGLPAKPIVGLAQSALQGGEIVVNGLCGVMWSAALDSWVLIQSTGGAVQLASGERSQQAVNVGQIQGQSLTAFTVTGAGPALSLSVSPAITAYAANQRFRVKFSAASSGADTLNISGRGAKSLKQYDASGAKVSAVFAVGQLADVEYDGTDIVLLNPLPAISQATESVAGVAKIATQPQTDAGVDDSKFVTPLKMRKGFSVVFGSTGYIALPSWMGGWIMQWVSAGAISGLATKGTATRPLVWLLTFPTEVLAQWGIAVGATTADVGMVATASIPTTTGMTLGIYNSAEASKNMSNTIGFAIGR